MSFTRDFELLDYKTWHRLSKSHVQRADSLTMNWQIHKQEGKKEPIEDFLFTYYSLRLNKLKQWMPGLYRAISVSENNYPVKLRWYKIQTINSKQYLLVDLPAFVSARKATLEYIQLILASTLNKQPSFKCFGLHEWAMVYGLSSQDIRHNFLPLRLAQPLTDEVVEKNQIYCSHFDAFRFFTDKAKPLNNLLPSRERQHMFEQPGCLHANMDLYKWASKITPLIGGELLLDIFELAKEIRILDMQASPYDVSEYGYEPVQIENSEGREQYQLKQEEFYSRAQVFRRILFDIVQDALQAVS